ncbi:hypothetical protein RUM43_001352 [Polyplax serrata]|uniref:Uncharacterized protein n=1 Tax=Polyplax serrata TaxID=468196 RepID=A0AAN8SHX4_POLSC
MSGYNGNVRIGNWYDELMLQDEKTKQYVRKTKNGELTIQKARKLFISLLTEIPLTFPVVGLSYGAIIEIVSPENPPKTIHKIPEKQGIALAGNIEFENSIHRSTFASGDTVIGTGLLTPCARNVWTLVPEDKSRKGKELRFGDTFHIQIVKSDPPLYVTAPVNSPLSEKGECDRVVPRLTSRTSNLTRFKVVHYNPRLRYDFEGTVVPPSEKISILQAANSQALAVETDTWYPTYFGMECEVSVHTFREAKDTLKPDPRNFWSFLLAAP